MTAVRVLKEHEERKNEILDAAQGLFYREGYDATPVNAIIEKVGVSKGTFYYYFNSKEELLDCLTARVTTRILGQMREATQKEGMDAVSRLNAFFLVAGRWKAANKEVILMLTRALYRDENVLLRHKMNRRTITLCAPELADIIRQGIADGVFDNPDPDEAAELIFQLAAAIGESTGAFFLKLEEEPELWPLIERKIESYQNAVERILGAPKGSVRFIDPETLEAFRP